MTTLKTHPRTTYYRVEVFNSDLPIDTPIWECWQPVGFAKVIPAVPDDTRFTDSERELVESTARYLSDRATELNERGVSPRGAMQLRIRAAALRVMLKGKGE